MGAVAAAAWPPAKAAALAGWTPAAGNAAAAGCSSDKIVLTIRLGAGLPGLVSLKNVAVNLQKEVVHSIHARVACAPASAHNAQLLKAHHP